MYRIVIIEDDFFLREKLRILLTEESSVSIVGVFDYCKDILLQLKDQVPDGILIGLDPSDKSSIELIRSIHKEMPQIDIIVFSDLEEPKNVLAAIRAGASGYILKQSKPSELIGLLHGLSYGGAATSPQINRQMIAEIQNNCSNENLSLLSQREKEILYEIERGHTYKTLASKLFISEHTVHTHIKNIYGKLEAKNRKEAIFKARRKGIL